MAPHPLELPILPTTVDATCYCLNAQRAARRFARLYDQTLRPVGLNHGQFSLLMQVAGLQPVTVGRVADSLVMDRSTVTAIVKPLERRGLLASTVSPEDRRRHLLALTPEGQTLLSRAVAAWAQAQQRVQAQHPRASLRSDLKRLAAIGT